MSSSASKIYEFFQQTTQVSLHVSTNQIDSLMRLQCSWMKLDPKSDALSSSPDGQVYLQASPHLKVHFEKLQTWRSEAHKSLEGDLICVSGAVMYFRRRDCNDAARRNRSRTKLKTATDFCCLNLKTL